MENDLNRFIDLHESELTESQSVNKIGIYKKVIENGQPFFRRDAECKSDFPFWADVFEIAPKDYNKKRIVLLGESVARGYFFEPDYSCANILKTFLEPNERSELDLIDLAKSGISFSELKEITLNSFELFPDAIIIFAGNNITVHDGILTDMDYAELSGVLSKGSGDQYRNIKEVIERRFIQVVTNFLEAVSEKAGIADVPIIFVIPEFNLADWRATTQFDRCIVWPKHSVTQIDIHIKDGDQSRLNKDFEELLRHGNELITLAPLLPIGYEFVADYWLAKGDTVQCKRFLILAKDCSIVRIGLLARIFSVTRTTILKWVSQSDNITIVDLSQTLQHYTSNGIPDKSLFMDYCHLSMQGLQIAMKEVAHVVACLLSLKKPESDIMDIDPLVLAKAHFCAALHCAHYGPQKDLILHHCYEAVKYSGQAMSWMKLYLDLVTKSIPWDLNPAFYQLLKTRALRHYEGGIQFFQPYNILDFELVKSILVVLEPHHPGITCSILAERNKNFAIDSLQEVNLLDSIYSKESYIANKSSNFHYQSLEIDSQFLLLVGKSIDVELTICYRLPHHKTVNHAYVYVNNHLLTSLNGGNEWTTSVFLVDRMKLDNNNNVIRIVWPGMHEKFSKHAQETDEEFVKRTYRPIYGEISAFKASQKSY